VCPVGEHFSVLPLPLVGVGDLHVVQAHSHQGCSYLLQLRLNSIHASQ
jgi:hypothetical protein